MKCRDLVKHIKNHEYLGYDLVPTKEISNNNKEKYKYFSPKYLTAMEWVLDNVDETLQTYFGDHESDDECNDDENNC